MIKKIYKYTLLFFRDFFALFGMMSLYYMLTETSTKSIIKPCLFYAFTMSIFYLIRTIFRERNKKGE